MAERPELARMLRRLFRRRPPSPAGGVEERLRSLEQGLAEVRSRLNWLLLWLSGAVALEVLLRMMGK